MAIKNHGESEWCHGIKEGPRVGEESKARAIAILQCAKTKAGK